MLWLLTIAEAAMAGTPLLAVRGVAESWSDPSIGSVYRTGALMGAVGAVIPIKGKVGINIEAAYRRAEPFLDPESSSRFESIPLSLLAEYALPAPSERVDVFAAAGFSMVAFSERHAADEDGATVTRGARPTLELRTGLRWNLGFQSTTMTNRESLFDDVFLEIYGARRTQLPSDTGFDLGAWRGALGLAISL